MAAGRAGFPRDARLVRPAEYQRVFRSPYSAGDSTMKVLALPNDLGHPRLGLAISRKAAHRAVARNRIKRVIRELFRASGDELGGLDIVVLARRGIDQRTNAELRAALDNHWKRLTRRCRSSSSC